jgi:hypothetical protein
MELKVAAGKSYKIHHRNSGIDPEKVHIDYVLDNPNYSHWASKLIVCRVWGRRRQRWHRYVYEYWQLAIANNWQYK